jgi:hypothetical protein
MECIDLVGEPIVASAAYFRVDELLRKLANPNLHDIPRNLPFRVEMWDGSDQHIRWVIAASASVAMPGVYFCGRKGGCRKFCRRRFEAFVKECLKKYGNAGWRLIAANGVQE